MNVPSSNLVSALSTALSYPTEGIDQALLPLRACLEDPANASYFAQINAVLDAVPAFTAEGVEQPQGAEMAQLEYTRLFIGSFKMFAPPYASYYLDEKQQVQGPTTTEIAEVYAQFGLRLAAEEHDCADHLHYLLAFTSLLLGTYEQRGQIEFVEAYRDFCDLYLTSWLPRFQELVTTHAQFPLYPELVRLLASALTPKAEHE